MRYYYCLGNNAHGEEICFIMSSLQRERCYLDNNNLSPAGAFAFGVKMDDLERRNHTIIELSTGEGWISISTIAAMFGVSHQRIAQILKAAGVKKHTKRHNALVGEDAKRQRINDRIDEFWSHVHKTDDGCWEWTGHKMKAGYGTFGLKAIMNEINSYTHHISWKLMYGDMPEGMYICHKCDNPACVNPEHLYAGTPLQNVQDREERWKGIPTRKRKQIIAPRRIPSIK